MFGYLVITAFFRFVLDFTDFLQESIDFLPESIDFLPESIEWREPVCDSLEFETESILLLFLLEYMLFCEFILTYILLFSFIIYCSLFLRMLK